MWHVTVQHPIACIFRGEFDIASLSHSDQDGIPGSPCCLGQSATLRPGHHKLVPVQMEGMMVHSEVDDTYPNALAELDHHRRRGGAGLPVHGEPVEFHCQSIGYGIVRAYGPFLKDQAEVAIDGRLMSLLGMDEEQSNHPHHFLHCHVRVIEERSVLIDRELVGGLLARLDWILREAGRAVHFERQLQAVPMRSRRLRQSILNHDPNTIALVDFDGWARNAAVVTPRCYGSAGHELGLDHLGDQVKFLDPARNGRLEFR